MTVVARGVPTPTQFAVFAGRLFVAGYGAESNPDVAGGVYVLGGGKAIRVPGSPHHVYGLAAGKNALYLSTNQCAACVERLERHAFSENTRRHDACALRKLQRTSCRARRVDLRGSGYLSTPPTSNYNSSLVSVDPATGSITVIASGMRQPWQPLFLPGHALPLVSDLNQDDLGPNRPPDYLLAIKRGANYGFPACPANPRTCAIYDQPLVRFPAHASPWGSAT